MFKGGNDDQTLVYIRHGDRIEYSKDQDEIQKWKHSERHRENSFDEPLSEKGIAESSETAVKLLDMIDISQYKYIYASPFTRTIDTARIIVDTIKKLTGHELKIRVEYGLHESQSVYYDPVITFKGDELVENFRTAEFNDSGDMIDNLIDEKLRYHSLLEKYGDYIDSSYKSLVSDTDTTIESPETGIPKYINTVKRITANDTHAIIVGHGGACFFLVYRYLTQVPYVQSQVLRDMANAIGGSKGVNAVAILEKINSEWQLKFGPTRLI